MSTESAGGESRMSTASMSTKQTTILHDVSRIQISPNGHDRREGWMKVAEWPVRNCIMRIEIRLDLQSTSI